MASTDSTNDTTSSMTLTTGAPAPPLTALIAGRADGLGGVHASREQHARDEQHDRRRLHDAGRADREQAAGERSHHGLDGVVDGVDGGDLVGDDLDRSSTAMSASIHHCSRNV